MIRRNCCHLSPLERPGSDYKVWAAAHVPKPDGTQQCLGGGLVVGVRRDRERTDTPSDTPPDKSIAWDRRVVLDPKPTASRLSQSNTPADKSIAWDRRVVLDPKPTASRLSQSDTPADKSIAWDGRVVLDPKPTASRLSQGDMNGYFSP